MTAVSRWGLLGAPVYLVAAVAFVAAATLPWPAGAQPADGVGQGEQAEAQGTLHLVVFGPPERLPVESAEVVVAGPVERPVEIEAWTDADGAAWLDLPAGEYGVEVTTPQGDSATLGPIEVIDGHTTEVVAELVAGGEALVDVETIAQEVVEAQVAQRESAPQGVPGTLAGQVVSFEDGQPIAGARVFVRGLADEAVTDEAGRFRLEVASGQWDLSVIHSEYSTESRDGVTVEPETTTEITVALTPASVRLQAYTVKIPRIEGGTIELLEQRRESTAATEVIGAEEFSKTGDSTAAGALKRVTGLTVVGGKYVYVRGLGERYSSTLLNGATLPSPEPRKRVVPLDLFPTSVLEAITIQKTYTPDMPGDFGGGVVSMKTRSIPDEFVLELGASAGVNTAATFQDGLGYQGGGLDWLGVDDGTRALPPRVAGAIEGKAVKAKDRFGRGSFTGEELEALGEALPNIWNTAETTVLPSFGVSAELGDRFELGGGDAFGALLSVSYDYGSELARGVDRSFAGEALILDADFDTLRTSTQVAISAVLAAGLELGEDHTIRLNSFVNRLSDDEVYQYEGFYFDVGEDIRVTRLGWVERQLMFHQLTGEHRVASAGDLAVEWGYVFSQATRDEPDRRQYRYDFTPQANAGVGTGAFVLSDRPEGNNRLWAELVDNTHDLSASVGRPFGIWSGLEASVEAGGALVLKTRDSDIRRLTFKASSIDDDLGTQPPESIFAPENIGPDGFRLVEITRPTDNYTAEQTVAAGYLMADVPLTDTLEISAGARLEHSDQQVDTFELFGGGEVSSSIVTTDVLPAVSARWKFAADMQLRAAFSQTVNRPNFQEMSPGCFDPPTLGGFALCGNPDIDRALIRHFDARWEWYPGRDASVSLGVFYKDFDQPIELTQRIGADEAVEPRNVAGATNWGVEAEARTKLGVVDDALRDLFVAVNGAYIVSEVQIDQNDQTALLTSFERPLQGQSPYVINAQTGWENVDLGTTVVLLYNVFGPRIASVSAYGKPDIYEQPFHALDLTVSQKLAEAWKVGAKAKNLLGEAVVLEVGDAVTERVEVGRSFSVSVDWSW